MRENHILIIDDDLMLLKTAEEILSDQYNPFYGMMNM